MHFTANTLVALLATLASAAPISCTGPIPGDSSVPARPIIRNGTAILQFEIDNDTFTSHTVIRVPGQLSFAQRPLTVIAAAVSSASGVDANSVRCAAFDIAGTRIGSEFGTGNPVDLYDGRKVAVDLIRCR